MKKILVCAMAAIVALASCSKTEFVENSAPTPIGFKAVTGGHTKAEHTNNNFTQSLGVFAIENEHNDIYLDNYAFGKSNGTWINNSAFWPFQTTLDFVVYSPAVTGSNASFDISENTLTVGSLSNVPTPDNEGIYTSSIGDQFDFLYGKEYYDGTGDGYGWNTQYANVSTEMNHALAKITLQFDCTNASVTKVAIKNPCLSGTYEVNYNSTPPVAEWTTATRLGEDLWLGGMSSNSVEIMVVPAVVSDFEIKYTIAGLTNEFSAILDLNNDDEDNTKDKWLPGYKYIYNVIISPKGIVFDKPDVSGWGNGGTVDL